MTDLQRPKLSPLSTAMFFRHFVSANSDVMPIHQHKRALPLMIVSNSFLLAAQESLRNSTVGVRLSAIRYGSSNMWFFHGLKTAFLTEQTALVIFKLTRPQIKKLVAMEYSTYSVKAIDFELLLFLIGIPEYEVRSEAKLAEYSLMLAEQLSSDGHLKMLSCKWGNLINGRRLRSLKADKYLGGFQIYKSPCDFAKILHHKFRQIHLRMRCFEDENIEINDYKRDIRHHEPMVSLSDTQIVQPAIEEIYLENLADRFQVDEPLFLPLNFYNHVPNLKKLFYSTHQSAVNYYYGESPSQALHKLVNFLDFMFKHVEQVFQNGTQTQFVFAINTTVFLNDDQSEKNWMEELVSSSVFADMKCELVTESEMLDRSDFQDTPTYHRFHCQSSSSPVLIFTSANMKMFLWARFDQWSQVQNKFNDEYSDSDETNEDWEDEYSVAEEMEFELEYHF
ncbi:hypothetical protein M3Y94_01012300 [Aphelenchoides besseyi]|nr:hypothetical protein M3Y94_01012300 [Aphelenchoides besseyi]KAI6220501.1 hypothetical protein M3Y95_01046600 [Aphelenchoides besseyi]